MEQKQCRLLNLFFQALAQFKVGMKAGEVCCGEFVESNIVEGNFSKDPDNFLLFAAMFLDAY